MAKRLKSLQTKTVFSDLHSSRRLNAWLLVLVFTLVIVAIIPYVRQTADVFKEKTSFEFLLNMGYLATAFLFVILFFWKIGLQKTSSFVLLLLALFAFSFTIFTRTDVPIEKVHMVEYAILSFLIYRALELDLPGGWVWFPAIVGCTLVACFDEGIQFLTPGRVGEWYDVVTDMTGGIFGVIFTEISRLERKRSAIAYKYEWEAAKKRRKHRPALPLLRRLRILSYRLKHAFLKF